MTENLKVLDLFCGAGGLSLGFDWGGFDVIAGVDYDEKAIETYRKNHNCPGYQTDISSTGPEEFFKETPFSANEVDVVAGGPPCQGFSISGDRNSDDERNTLVLDFLDYVEHIEPDAVVMENVEGIRSMDDGGVVSTIHSRFSNMGYDSKDILLNAKDYGVPQRRKRVVFIALRNGENIKLFNADIEKKTVGDVLGDFSQCPNHNTPNHQDKTRERIRDTKQGEPLYDSYTQRIRLEKNTQAPTLVCGGPRPQWQYGHPTQDRGLTVRERAALQTFPNDYEFCGGVVSGRVQTGNAVPPKMAEVIASDIKEKIKIEN